MKYKKVIKGKTPEDFTTWLLGFYGINLPVPYNHLWANARGHVWCPLDLLLRFMGYIYAFFATKGLAKVKGPVFA